MRNPGGRRKATAQELREGQRQMEEAQRRLEREAQESGELQIEDGPRPTEAQEPRDDARSSTMEVAEVPKALEDAARTVALPSPAGNPVPFSPVQPAPTVSSPAAIQDQPMTTQVGPRTPQVLPPIRDSPFSSQREEHAPFNNGAEAFQQRREVAGPTPQKDSTEKVQTPLFDEFQLRRFNELAGQAPWLYQQHGVPMTAPPHVGYPQLARPLFLDQDEARLRAVSGSLQLQETTELGVR